MDAALAQPPTYQSSYIPNEIYRPLLEIAQQGYDANDIIHWYLTIKQRIDSVGIAIPYSLTPPFSVCSPVPRGSQAQLLSNEPISPLEANFSTQNLYGPASTNLSPWPEHLSFNTPKQAPLNVTTSTSMLPQEVGATSNDLQSSILQMLSPWSPSTTPKFQDLDEHTSSTSVSRAEDPGSNITTSPQWFTPGPLNALNTTSRKRSASQSSIYQGGMNNAAMSMLPPPEQSPHQHSSHFIPVTNSGEITYLAPISIIPSRKRRKTARKGEKKVLQPMHLARQSI